MSKFSDLSVVEQRILEQRIKHELSDTNQLHFERLRGELRDAFLSRFIKEDPTIDEQFSTFMEIQRARGSFTEPELNQLFGLFVQQGLGHTRV